MESSLAASIVWARTSHDLGLAGVQLAAALQEPDSYVPPERMLDPVASHLPVRTFKDGTGVDLSDADAREIAKAFEPTGIFDLGVFENALVADAGIRNQVHQHLLRCFRASLHPDLRRVGCRGITTFVGGDPTKSIDENIALFEERFIPLLREMDRLNKEAGAENKVWIENCPMPGWGVEETTIFNIASTPFMWVILTRIADKHGLGHMLRFTYDASHDILNGSTPFLSFSFLKAAGYAHIVDRFHGKDQNRIPGQVAAHTMLGRRAGLGIRHRETGLPVDDPSKLGGAWGRMTAFHTLPMLSPYNPAAQAAGVKVDWLAHQLHARSILGVDPSKAPFIIEHEWGAFRDPNDIDGVMEALRLSAQGLAGIDAAADAIFRGEQWAKDRNLPWIDTVPSPFGGAIYGLDEAVASALSFPA